MEILSLVSHIQRQQDLIYAIAKVQDFSHTKKLNKENMDEITEKINRAFNAYNEGNNIDTLEVKISFDNINGRINMDINQIPLIANLHSSFIIQ